MLGFDDAWRKDGTNGITCRSASIRRASNSRDIATSVGV
jgi:hypothetical protein